MLRPIAALVVFALTCGVAVAEDKLVGMLFFNFNSDSINETGLEAIEGAVDRLKAHNGKVAIFGHADAEEENPNDLSGARARFIVRLLVANGIQADRLSMTAEGSQKRFVPEKDPQNRRVEIVAIVPTPPLSGKGTWDYGNGIYEGDFANGAPQGDGVFVYKDGARYEGQFQNGAMHGRGRQTYADGGVYDGDWADNRIAGRGRIVYADRGSYEGDWVNGVPEGYGVRIWPNGDRYEGQFRSGRLEGSGVVQFAGDGSRYEGLFRNNQAHGRGKKTYRDGRTFNGQWNEGCLRQGNLKVSVGTPISQCK